jgi:RNA polymerase primary sigma factor
MTKRKKDKIPAVPSVGHYLDEINACAPLTREEEGELARRIRAGEAKALEKLVKSNLKFVVTVAKSYQGRGLPLPDLIGEGNSGLIKAAHRFDETKGYKFISYAVWWVRQAILQALAEQGRIVRLPLNRINAIMKMGHATDALQRRLGREPSMEEVAKALDTSAQKLGEVMHDNARELSLNQSASDEENDGLINFLENDQYASPDEMLMQESLQDEIAALLAQMEPRTAEIVRRYFGLNGYRPHSLEMLGHQFKLTRERVRQIKEKALKKLRHGSKSRALREYL